MSAESPGSPLKPSAAQPSLVATDTTTKPAPRNKAWRIVRTALNLALLGVVLYYVVLAMRERLVAITWQDVHVGWGAILLASGLVALGRVLGIIQFRLLVEPFCTPPRWPGLLVVAWVSPMGKYVPGKVASAAGAVLFLKRFGVPAVVGVNILLILSGLVVLVGLTVGMPLTLWHPVGANYAWAQPVSLAMLAVGVVCLHPRVFFPAANFALGRFHRGPVQRIPALKDYVGPILTLAGEWCLIGMAVWILARAQAGTPFAWYPFMVSAMALAGTLGILAFFAPAGIGVREGVLLLAFAPMIRQGGDIAIVVLMIRLVQTVVEAVLAGIGLAVLRACPRACVARPEDKAES
jgi:uncharacterized membrane protein YbhN (UPF0104 family)